MQKGYSMPELGFDNRVAVITGELLASMAGRVAKAFVAETPGMCHPKWTIEHVSEDMVAIRDTDRPVVFPPAPSGHIDRLRYSFAMARAGGAPG